VPVERVEDRGQSEHAQQPAERPRQLHLGKERETPAAVARDWRAVPKHDPPALAAPLLGNRHEQAIRLFVGLRKQREFLAAVEPGDDPRRPAAELSAA
jgi:hypothetical protein